MAMPMCPNKTDFQFHDTILNNTIVYLNLMQNLTDHMINTTGVITSGFNVSNLFDYIDPLYRKDLEDSYASPMVKIGMYIAVASLLCVLLMFADLVHGLRSKKYWFPSKYFAMNAFTLTLIAVAMKLPVDLSGSMPGVVDQVTKLGSMAFMCVMMANFLPSLATMDKFELLASVTGLGVLVITSVVNICIQINTGVIVKYGKEVDKPLEPLVPRGNEIVELRKVANETLYRMCSAEEDEPEVIGYMAYTRVAISYVVVLLVLLLIHVSSSLAIVKSKEIMQRVYIDKHVEASKGVRRSRAKDFLTVEKLRKHVNKYWIMAGSSSPQFMSVCSTTTTASGVICFYTAFVHILAIYFIIQDEVKRDTEDYKFLEGKYGSDYKWSTVVILIVQFIGVIVGTVAPVCRSISSNRFKVHKSFGDHIKFIFEIEKYWTQKLYDWKYGYTILPLIKVQGNYGHKIKVLIKYLEKTILGLLLWLCILLQMLVVGGCKLIEFFGAKPFSSGGTRTEKYSEQREYVLQLKKEDELADRTLRGLLNSLDRLIQKSENRQPKNLMNFITEKSTHGFQGVRKYDNNYHQVHETYADCWSLPVITLTAIVVSTLPNTDKVEVDRLLKSVREGLEYIMLVEETFDDNSESIRTAKWLWKEVDFHHKWLGIKLKDIASQAASEKVTTLEIFQQIISSVDKSQCTSGSKTGSTFLIKAKKKIKKRMENNWDDRSKFTPICVSLMSRITQTIIADKESQNDLFDQLSSMIADIMAACLTNLPQVIVTKCHTNVIEKRETSVIVAAKLLGETKQIINTLQADLLKKKWEPYFDMSTDDLPFINKWRAHSSSNLESNPLFK